MISVRLVMAVIGTLLWEVGMVVVALWLLPMYGMQLPPGVLVALGVALAVYGVVSYRLGSRALRKRPVAGMTSMLGSRGKAATALAPQGVVRIKGELWEATAAGTHIDAGEQVMVVGEDGLRLTVQRVKVAGE